MKQFNGYFGCSKCKEKGQQHVIGIGKGGRKKQCHIYPYNRNFSDGHCEVRCHGEVKEQALQALRNRKDGLKSVSPFTPKLMIQILPIIWKDNVWVMSWELIVQSAFVQGSSQIPSSPNCTIIFILVMGVKEKIQVGFLQLSVYCFYYYVYCFVFLFEKSLCICSVIPANPLHFA